MAKSAGRRRARVDGGRRTNQQVDHLPRVSSPPLTREDRAAKAKVEISTHFNTKQQVFLDFVLSHYVEVGVDELSADKLTPLLRLKYHDSIADAVADLGSADTIKTTFSGFQKYLYDDAVA